VGVEWDYIPAVLQCTRKCIIKLAVMHFIFLEFDVLLKLIRLIRLIKGVLNNTYRKVHVGKYLLDLFPIQNYLKEKIALSLFIFKYS
jgi:hypothetical protein